VGVWFTRSIYATLYIALIAAGFVSSLQIWFRAFDGGAGLPAATPRPVPPTHHRKVPATIRRWTTPPAPARPAPQKRAAGLVPSIGPSGFELVRPSA
jgi:hypothetical protein